jgi:outer membrane receptor protein involved in Fe transport
MFSRIGPAVALVVALGPASVALAQAGRAGGPGDSPSASASAAAVRVTGTVRDEQNAIPLPGLPVEVVGTSQVVYTDVDGRYLLDLAPGTYELRVAMDGYQERTIRVVAEGRSIVADVGLSMTRYAEEVTVVADILEAATSTAAAQLVERKNAAVVADNLSGEEMKANADGDAAAAMSRVTGLSVIDGQYVFVRGLGERYSNTTLNGAVLPTTEPDKKVVPLDMFPSGLLNSVSVVKSYSPDRSAEFAGGLVEIQSLRFPAQTVALFSWNLGFNSITTGKDVPGSVGGGRDWLGFDDGTRSLPAGIPNRKVIRGGIYTPDVGLLRSDLVTIGRAFPNNWNLAPRSARPNQSGSATFGGRFGRLGLLASYTQSYKEQFVREKQIFYRGSAAGLSEFSNYDFDIATKRASLGAVVNLMAQFSPSHRLKLENFYSHSGRDESRTFEGFNSDINTVLRNQRLFWVEEELLSNGLGGEHFFRALSNSRLDWRVTRSAAQRDEPDLREVLYERQGTRFVLADESQSGLRMFNFLDDDSTDFAANWSVYGSVNRRPIQLKVGAQHVDRARDFSSRRFRFVPTNTVGLDTSAAPETIFASANIGPRYEIKEETRTTDTYAAEQRTTAFYGMTDVTLGARVRLIAGARVERFEQDVDTFDQFDFNDDPEVIRANIEETDIFPSVNLVFSPRPTHNLRLGFSQTVNRPEFREVAPFEFTDVVGGRAMIGNPNLQRALIQNYDIRYEIFPGAEDVLAASFFVKRFDDPIERIIEPTAQLRTSFTNADSARNIGLEFEGRRRLAKRLLVGANYTWVDSNITLTPQAAQVQTSLERALAGQSRHLFNAFAELATGPATVRLLYNYFDERISDVGSVGLPDIFEQGRGTLDLVASARLGRLNLRLSADNLTDADYELTQGGLTQRLYRLGRTYTVNLGFSGF